MIKAQSQESGRRKKKGTVLVELEREPLVLGLFSVLNRFFRMMGVDFRFWFWFFGFVAICSVLVLVLTPNLRITRTAKNLGRVLDDQEPGGSCLTLVLSSYAMRVLLARTELIQN